MPDPIDDPGEAAGAPAHAGAPRGWAAGLEAGGMTAMPMPGTATPAAFPPPPFQMRAVDPKPPAGPGDRSSEASHGAAPAPTASAAAPADEAAAEASPAGTPAVAAPRTRSRPRPGERRVQILQTLAAMLEKPGSDRVTTAALAARLQVSEAALYRHFASKAQMYEGLIEFIESSVFTLVNQIVQREPDAALQARRIVQVVLQFGEKNPGMVRVMVGDALVFEHERLIARMNQFFDRLETQLRQSLRDAGDASGAAAPTAQAQALASALVSLVIGRLQRYARSGFRRSPVEHLETALARLTG